MPGAEAKSQLIGTTINFPKEDKRALDAARSNVASLIRSIPQTTVHPVLRSWFIPAITVKYLRLRCAVSWLIGANRCSAVNLFAPRFTSSLLRFLSFTLLFSLYFLLYSSLVRLDQWHHTLFRGEWKPWRRRVKNRRRLFQSRPLSFAVNHWRIVFERGHESERCRSRGSRERDLLPSGVEKRPLVRSMVVGARERKRDGRSQDRGGPIRARRRL